MRKLAVLILAIIFSTASCYAWGWKKDTGTPLNQEYHNEGKGYVGTLPDISKNFKSSEPKSTKPIYEKMFNLQQENKNLVKLRDTLLPKLMNGEIDLDKIEI